MNVIHHINITDHIKKGTTYDLIKNPKKVLGNSTLFFRKQKNSWKARSRIKLL